MKGNVKIIIFLKIKDFEKVLYDKKMLHNTREEYLKLLSTHGEGDSLYICDKMPHNFIFIGLIRIILPEAKIIYCKRDPIDNCFSLYSHKFVELAHQYSYNQKILAKYYKL